MAFVSGLFGWRGRVGRLQFVLLTLPYIFVLFAFQFATMMSANTTQPAGFFGWINARVKELLLGFANGDPPILTLAFVAVAVIMFVSATIRRLHDRGRSGAWVLVFFVNVFLMAGIVLAMPYGFTLTQEYMYPLVVTGAIFKLVAFLLYLSLVTGRSRDSTEVPQSQAS